MDPRERFLAVMEYQPVDRVPNWEAGAWEQTRERWKAEEPATRHFHWRWFWGEEPLDMDPREFVRFDNGVYPALDEVTLAEDERTVTFRDSLGRVRRALKEGMVGQTRMSMDTYLSFPVRTLADWRAMERRFEVSARRLEPNWRAMRVEGWRRRRVPLIFGENCSTLGFYWFAREMLGTEGLSYAFYDDPALVHAIMEHQADFLIESARPVLAETSVDYICLNEDLSYKTGPLLSPKCFSTFILPRLRRVIDFYKSNGVRYICVDTDGNPEAVIPLMMDIGVDAIWPMERAADQDPLRLRRKYGRSLRLWGGVDKRALAEGPAAIDAHLAELRPLIAEGGFIPTVDHVVPPDVSWANFRYYMESKARLLRGE